MPEPLPETGVVANQSSEKFERNERQRLGFFTIRFGIHIFKWILTKAEKWQIEERKKSIQRTLKSHKEFKDFVFS